MAVIEVLDRGILFENPVPLLKSRNGYFPGVIELPDKTLMAMFVEGEAFESTDQTTMVSTSNDGGKTWNTRGPVYDKQKEKNLTTDSIKPTVIDQQKIIALGYRFIREPETPIGNPETGGVRPSEIIFFKSCDQGNTWEGPRVIPNSFTEGVEASSPVVELHDCTWVTPIANFADWGGQCRQGYHGRLLYSKDKGNSWSDDIITMEFPGRDVTVWEQRLCQLETGQIVVIAWNEDIKDNKPLANHYTVSENNGLSFSQPQSTGIMGQASSLTSLTGSKLLSLHCIRRDTDNPGIKACIIDIHKGNWNTVYETMIWKPQIPIQKDNSMIEQFAFLKFGQPSAIRLNDGCYYMVHWYVEEGKGKIAWMKLNISC